MVFLDADKEGYIDYLEKLLPMARPGGVILAHNINPRMAHPPFMEAITTNPELETVVRGGMSITLKKDKVENKTPHNSSSKDDELSTVDSRTKKAQDL